MQSVFNKLELEFEPELEILVFINCKPGVPDK